jgi:hypothetical protein
MGKNGSIFEFCFIKISSCKVFTTSTSTMTDCARKRRRTCPSTTSASSLDPFRSDSGAGGELRLAWFRDKDVPNVATHVIKLHDIPKAEIVDSARVNIILDIEFENKRLVAEAAKVAKDPAKAQKHFWERALENVAKYYKVSVTTLKDMRKALKDSGSPRKKQRSGRPPVYKKSAVPFIIKTMKQGNGRTAEQAVKLMEEDFPLQTTTVYKGHVRHSPSTGTVAHVMLESKKVNVARRPFLSFECMQVRFTFSKMIVSRYMTNPHRAEAHLDESYITLAFGGTGTVYDHPLCPLLEAEKVHLLKSRTHATQIMVLIVIARPKLLNPDSAGARTQGEAARFDKLQNGKVAIFRIVDEIERQRSRHIKDEKGRTIEFKKKGEILFKPANLNAEKYMTLMTRKDGILDKVRKYFGDDVVLTLQEDGAPPHGKITRNTAELGGTHETLKCEAKKLSIDLVGQPPNSPELNACDLGVWRALKSLVKAKNLPDVSWKHVHEAQDHLWMAILEAWGKLEAKAIFNVFEVRTEVARQLVANEGGILVKEPHSGVRKKWGTY